MKLYNKNIIKIKKSSFWLQSVLFFDFWLLLQVPVRINGKSQSKSYNAKNEELDQNISF